MVSVMRASSAEDESPIKRRAWVLLVGLPLLAGALGIALVAFWSYYAALVLLFGPPASAMNYRRLKAMTKKSDLR
jgi:hypothetical protein